MLIRVYSVHETQQLQHNSQEFDRIRSSFKFWQTPQKYWRKSKFLMDFKFKWNIKIHFNVLLGSGDEQL